jgi:hypothetical protein
MRPQDVVGGPTVFGNSRLPVGGVRDEHHVAGSSTSVATSLVQQLADVVNRRRSPGPPSAQVPAFRPSERG